MKTMALAALLLAALISVRAQQITGACSITSLTTEYVSSKASARYPGKCDLTINLTWSQDANNGNKYSYVHIWPEAAYQSFTYTNPANPPMAANLSATLGTIVIKDPSSSNPTLYSSYNPDDSYKNVFPLAGSAPLTLKKKTVANIDYFTVENLELLGVTCNASNIYALKADAWSSQQSQGKNVHCVAKGNPFSLNRVINQSVMNCAANAVQVKLLSNSASCTGTVTVFADLNTFGQFDATTDALVATQPFCTSAAAVAAGTWAYQFAASLAVPLIYRRHQLYVLVNVAGSNSAQVFKLANGCAPLPENLAYFTANRTRNNVNLKWETVNEQNSKGFAVERKTNGGWEEVGFVPSNAGGNSSVKTAYEFNDVNKFGGVSQYRVAEVTAGNKRRLSEIRAVRGESQASKLMVFPNPSTNGNVNLVFENQSTYDVTVTDLMGHVIKSFKNTNRQSLLLENLRPGVYAVQMLNHASNEVVTERFVVTK